MAENKGKSVDECLQAFKSGTIITLNIGSGLDKVSYQVQQGILEATSEYFRAAFKEDRFIEGETHTISFEDDDVDAWKILLYWILNHELTGILKAKALILVSHVRLAVDCWVLGDKYMIGRFQDDIMLELIELYHTRRFVPAADCLKVWFPRLSAVPPESKLMRLVAEELAQEYNNGALSWSDLSILDGITGLWPELLRARELLLKDKTCFGNRFERGLDTTDAATVAHWSTYMVSSTPPVVEYLRKRE